MATIDKQMKVFTFEVGLPRVVKAGNFRVWPVLVVPHIVRQDCEGVSAGFDKGWRAVCQLEVLKFHH